MKKYNAPNRHYNHNMSTTKHNDTQQDTAQKIQLLVAYISKAQSKGVYSLKDSHTIYSAIMSIKKPDATQEEKVQCVTVFINAVQTAMTKGVFSFEEVIECVHVIRVFNNWKPDYWDDVKHRNNLQEAFCKMADAVSLELPVGDLVKLVDAYDYIDHIQRSIVPVDIDVLE